MRTRDHQTNKWSNILTPFYDTSQTLEQNGTETFRIITGKSYFYTFEKEDSKRKAYAQKGDEVEKIGVQENGWIDCKSINSAGIKTEGYLKSSTLQRIGSK